MLDRKVFRAIPVTAVTRATRAERTLALEVRLGANLAGLELLEVVVSQLQDRDHGHHHVGAHEIVATAPLAHRPSHLQDGKREEDRLLSLHLHLVAVELLLQLAGVEVLHDLLRESQCPDRVHLPEKLQPGVHLIHHLALALAHPLPNHRLQRLIHIVPLDVDRPQDRFHALPHETKTQKDAVAQSRDLSRLPCVAVKLGATQAVVHALLHGRTAAKLAGILRRAQRKVALEVGREAFRDQLRL